MPVTIMQPPIQVAVPQPIQAPADWAPVVYEAQAFAVSNEKPTFDDFKPPPAVDVENDVDDPEDGVAAHLLG